MPQRKPVQKLHRDERLAVLVVNFVDGADVRMIQCRGGFGFALKAAECLRVFGYLVGQEFERNKATELHICGLIDHAHAAAADLAEDAVVRDGLADHAANLTSVKLASQSKRWSWHCCQLIVVAKSRFTN